MNKQEIERIFRSAKAVPVARDTIEGREVYIADGFLSPRDIIRRRRAELNVLDFPYGAYETAWWVAKGEGKLHIGRVFWCEAFHDRSLSTESKRQARIARAKDDARMHIRSLNARH